MDLRQRHRGGGGPAAGGEGGGDDLVALRADAADFLSAGDDAIDRALSQDSRAFLTANRQHGGQ